MCDILNFETYILILIFTIFLLFILLKFPLSIKNDFFHFELIQCVFFELLGSRGSLEVQRCL